MLYKIALFCLFSCPLFSVEEIHLKAPNISRENILGITAGVRPFRMSGVRLEAERIEDKLFIHNYGYGGSGLTLAFGGAQEALELLEKEKHPSTVVAVLGAGVAGLATAYDLLEKGYEVHLYAAAWPPHLTSNVAAGIWSPLKWPRRLPDEKVKLHQRMLELSEQRFMKSLGESPEFAGVRIISHYRFSTLELPEDPIMDALQHEIAVHFDNGVVKGGRGNEEIGIDGGLFIEDLYSKVKAKGARLHQQRFETLEELLALQEPIIINCSSIGSAKLFSDQDFFPVRGQVVYFPAQEGIDCLLSQPVLNNAGTNDLFFFFLYPWSDRLILGGVYEMGEDEELVNPEAVETILQHAERCLSGR